MIAHTQPTHTPTRTSQKAVQPHTHTQQQSPLQLELELTNKLNLYLKDVMKSARKGQSMSARDVISYRKYNNNKKKTSVLPYVIKVGIATPRRKKSVCVTCVCARVCVCIGLVYVRVCVCTTRILCDVMHVYMYNNNNNLKRAHTHT